MGGGSILRAVGRAVSTGTGVKDAISPTSVARPATPTRVVSVSTRSSSSAASASLASRRSYHCICDGEEEIGEGRGIGFSDRFVFGPVPSKEEVEEAVSTIHQIFVPVTFSQVTGGGFPSSLDKVAVGGISASTGATQSGSSAESESDWIEPSLQLHSSKTFQSDGREKVLDAFRLLQINPSIQRMVVSLSSDKDVWDAVMKNEVVQELKESLYAGGSNISPPSSDEGPDIATRILRWILDNTKARVLEFADKITKLVNELLHPQERVKDSDTFEDALRSSFMLSVVVFIVVIMTRVQRS